MIGDIPFSGPDEHEPEVEVEVDDVSEQDAEVEVDDVNDLSGDIQSGKSRIAPSHFSARS